jgi:hypothetical protein
VWKVFVPTMSDDAAAVGVRTSSGGSNIPVYSWFTKEVTSIVVRNLNWTGVGAKAMFSHLPCPVVEIRAAAGGEGTMSRHANLVSHARHDNIARCTCSFVQ